MIKEIAQPSGILGWISALADPTRLRLLRVLERHELGVADLCDVLQLPQSTVSRHLKVLADQSLVKARRVATNHLYRTILDELEPGARKLWLLTRAETEDWATVAQDQLRLDRVLRRRQGDVQNFFAGAAAEWDKIRTELYGDGFSNSACLALLDDRAAVADLGCGTGQIAEAISPFVRQVICVDDSPAMLKAARRRLSGASNVEIRRGELASVPIDKGSCDAALMILALTYVIDPQPVLAEMSRILKPGGKAVLVDLLKHDRDDFRRQTGQHWPGFETEQISIWLAEAGFRVHGIRSLAPEKNAKGPALWLASAIKLEANR